MTQLRTTVTGFLAASLFLVSHSLKAQEELSPLHGGVYASFAIPSGPFKDAVDNGKGGLGMGLDLHVLANPFGKRKWSPIYIGGGAQYLYFGRDKIPGTDDAPPYKTSFNYYGVNGMARLIPLKKDGFNIFVDGMLGFKIMNARTKIDKNALETLIDDAQPEVINNATDTGLSFGAGLGFFTKRYSLDEDGNYTGKASFSIRIAYVWGDKMTHVKRGSLLVDNGFVSYEQGHTSTNMIQIQIGAYIF